VSHASGAGHGAPASQRAGGPGATPPDKETIISRGIERRAFPSAVVERGTATGVTWRQAFGRLTYEEDAAATTDETIYDLASLTKVLATTTRAMQAVEAGALALDDRVSTFLPEWRGSDRESVTMADLLEHASGLTAYLPFFRDPQGRAEFQRAICTLPLEYAPRSQSIYSDLGFILLGFVLEDLGFPLDGISGLKAGATYSAESGHGEGLSFGVTAEERARCAPTELDLWRGRLLQGEVHDENAWALGGVAGHAGMFGTAESIGVFAREVLRAFAGETTFARPDTLARFVQKSSVPGSSRALGWDTMLPTSSCGTRMSPRAIGHTGFTGTSLWIDPELDLYVVFLTNRVHPARDNNAIQPVRRALHDAIVTDVHTQGTQRTPRL
jgi:CubicO group peptidase (beta-lactamase class C family)